MSDTFEWSRPVEFHETDLAGIAHFSNFYRWMEATEHSFLANRGIDLLAGEVAWPRVKATADFKKPIQYGDIVRVRLTLIELGGRSVRYAFEIRANDDEQLRASGEMISACIDLQTMKAVEIPQEIREKLSGN